MEGNSYCEILSTSERLVVCPREQTIKNLVQELGDLQELMDDPDVGELAKEDANQIQNWIENIKESCPIKINLVKNSRQELVTSEVVEKPNLLSLKVATAGDIKKLARKAGLMVTKGNGRHGVHIVTPDGTSRPLPDHPGDLSFGVTKSLTEWISDYAS